ncbi:MAG: hypothetical protein WCB18_10105 [Thermoplasmata archaeon]
MKSRLAIVFGGLLILDFILVIVMLATDKNLQTDFGGSAPYYIHWYAGLCIGVVTLLVALFILATSGRTTSDGKPTSMGRLGVLGGTVWAWLVVIGLFGVVATYSQVGFQSASQFAHYLFGVSAYPGSLSYVPWLYDAVIGMFIVSAIVGVVAVMHIRAAQQTGST